MADEIHPLVQDANHFDAIRGDSEKDYMRSSRISTVTTTDAITGFAFARITSDAVDRVMKLAHLAVSLVAIPTIGGVAPDFSQIRTSAW